MEDQAYFRGLLAASGLFRDCCGQALDLLGDEAELVTVPRGATLIREGEAGNHAYLVLSGRVRVVVGADTDRPRQLAELGPGEIFGEMALLSAAPRGATVFAVRETHLAMFSRSTFERLANEDPQWGLLVARQLAERLRRSGTEISRRSVPRTVTLVAAHEGAALGEISAGLVTGFAREGETRVVSRESMPAATTAARARAMAEIEQRAALVIYQAGPGDDEWTRACVDHADAVLVVASATAGEREWGGAVASLLRLMRQDVSPAMYFVLRHSSEPAAVPPIGRRLRGASFAAHLHVRSGVSEDLARLSRHLRGSATGLVLGGGGARGIAHLGVVRALRERGIAIDAVAGTSFGGLVAAAIAKGWDDETMAAAFRDILVRRRALFDYTFPVVALTAGRRLGKILRDVFGDTEIEELMLPFFCIASDLTRGTVAIRRSGRLRDALRASVSIPGVFPPVEHEGALLVDGGLMANCPVDAMFELVSASGRVIASDVTGRSGLLPGDLGADGIYPGFSRLVAPLRALAGNKRHRAPSVVATLTSCVAMADRSRDAGTPGSRCLRFRPPVQAFGFLEWRSFDALVEAGYRHAVEVLESQAAPFG